MADGLNTTEIGRRLKATRKALGLNATEFSGRAGIKQNAYSQYETGERMLTLTSAVKLAAEHRLTLDWLYRGDASGLPHGLAKKLMAPVE